MKTIPPNSPLPVKPPPEFVDTEFEPLLAEPFAAGWVEPAKSAPLASALRERVAARAAASRKAELGKVTVRRRRAPRFQLSDGVSYQRLYRASRTDGMRPGEPVRATLIELAPGSVMRPTALREWDELDLLELHREWLVVSGTARLQGLALSQRDYHVVPAGHGTAEWVSEDGALLFLRESSMAAGSEDAPFTVFDAEAGWPDFAPGIQRRVLWQRDGQAALLYYARPGAAVPQHKHGHDEECLMVQGELFLDDILLQTGDYQLAPAGSGHRITETDTGVVIYAHGDLDLQFVA